MCTATQPTPQKKSDFSWEEGVAVHYENRGGSFDFRLPTSDFRLPKTFWALVVHGQCLLKRPFFVSSQDAEPLWSASRLLKGQRYLKLRAGVSARVGRGGVLRISSDRDDRMGQNPSTKAKVDPAIMYKERCQLFNRAEHLLRYSFIY